MFMFMGLDFTVWLPCDGCVLSIIGMRGGDVTKYINKDKVKKARDINVSIYQKTESISVCLGSPSLSKCLPYVLPRRSILVPYWIAFLDKSSANLLYSLYTCWKVSELKCPMSSLTLKSQCSRSRERMECFPKAQSIVTKESPRTCNSRKFLWKAKNSSPKEPKVLP